MRSWLNQSDLQGTGQPCGLLGQPDNMSALRECAMMSLTQGKGGGARALALTRLEANDTTVPMTISDVIDPSASFVAVDSLSRSVYHSRCQNVSRQLG